MQAGPGVDAPLFEEVFRDNGDSTTQTNLDSREKGLLWAVTDHAGTVRDVLANDHALVEHREYDAHGALLLAVDADKSDGGDAAPDRAACGCSGFAIEAVPPGFNALEPEWLQQASFG